MSISHRFIIRTAAAAVLAVLSSLLITEPATAAAGAGEAAPSVTVKYHDLNLNSPEGIASLYRRIRGAADQVCYPLESRELARKALSDECFNHAVADAVKAVHNRTLSAYHWQRIRGWKYREIGIGTAVASR